MKYLFLWLLIAVGSCFCLAQTKMNKAYPLAKGQTVDLHFDYPKTVHLSTWEGNEVLITATIKINNGESDKAFTLVESESEGKISISNKLDMDLIPDNYYIIENGSKIRFNTKQDMTAYTAEKGGKITSTYQTKDIEISIDIKVPAHVSTEVASVYGLVEVSNFDGPIKIDAKYGGVDVSVAEKAIGKLQLTTQYGKIYTNLNLRPTEQVDKSFFTSITALPGKGPEYNLKSAFGNIYLRSSLK